MLNGKNRSVFILVGGNVCQFVYPGYNLFWFKDLFCIFRDCSLKTLKTIYSSLIPLENLKNIVSFTRFFKNRCTIHHYTEKNGTGVTLKWKREKFVLICGRKGREKGFSALKQ